MIRGREKGFSSAFVAIFAVALLCLPAAGQAATITVNTGAQANDSNDSTLDSDILCSLREAVRAANQDSTTVGNDSSDCTAVTSGVFGNDTIQIDSIVGTVTLDGTTGTNDDASANGDLDVKNDGGSLTIEGLGPTQTTIAVASPTERILDVPNAGPPSPNVTLKNLIISGGNNLTDPSPTLQIGGAIDFEATNTTLTLDHTTVTGNDADAGTSSHGFGGGIHSGGLGQTVSLTNDSHVTGNSARSIEGPPGRWRRHLHRGE